jgi:hypothetical protein
MNETTAADMARMRTELIESMVQKLHSYYVFPEIAQQIELSVRGRLASGAYNQIDDPRALCEALTADMQAINHDKHLRLFYSPEPIPPRENVFEDPAWLAEMHQRSLLDNFGFQKVERLAGNVGYLDFRYFASPESAGETAVTAMNFLAHTSAMIVDLRRNDGGDPAMVALLCSYFFSSEPVHLNSLYWRASDLTQQYWTLPYVPGRRYLDKPVYVLTSTETFSGAEEFTYNLKNLKRATIVGETTGGGAHPGDRYQITSHIEAFIPTGRAINPVSKTNWEGTGVAPDIAVPAEQALGVAYREALKAVLSALGEHPSSPLQDLADEARLALEGLYSEDS